MANGRFWIKMRTSAGKVADAAFQTLFLTAPAPVATA